MIESVKSQAFSVVTGIYCRDYLRYIWTFVENFCYLGAYVLAKSQDDYDLNMCKFDMTEKFRGVSRLSRDGWWVGTELKNNVGLVFMIGLPLER